MVTTSDEIQTARQIANEIGADIMRAKFSIDWAKTKRDARNGRIYAWDKVGNFLGQFGSHNTARNAGAHVTRIGTSDNWFVWVVKHVA